MRVGSLFTGIGGMDLGFTAAGAEIAWQSEIDHDCSAVLAERFPELENLGDITEIDFTSTEPVDVLIGGFPCQGLSQAGLRKGLADERSALFFEFVRAVEELPRRPTWVVIENVPGLLTSQRGADFRVVLEALADLGYACAWRVVDSLNHGVPQRRRRVLVVGRLGDGRGPREVLLEPEGSPWSAHPRVQAWQEVARAVEDGLGSLRVSGDVANTLQASLGHHGHSSPRGGGNDNLVVHLGARPDGITTALTNKLWRGTGGPAGDEHHQMVVVVHLRQDPISGEGHSLPLEAKGPMAVALGVALRGRDTGNVPELGDEAAYAVRTAGGGSSHPMAVLAPFRKIHRPNSAEDPETWASAEVANTLNTFDVGEARATQMVVEIDPSTLRVRRLTPLECERLQGFPDGWTDVVSRRFKNGSVRRTSDSARYKMLGNAVTVPVFEWLAHRLVAWEHDVLPLWEAVAA